jgi:hypothetical protein
MTQVYRTIVPYLVADDGDLQRKAYVTLASHHTIVTPTKPQTRHHSRNTSTIPQSPLLSPPHHTVPNAALPHLTTLYQHKLTLCNTIRYKIITKCCEAHEDFVDTYWKETLQHLLEATTQCQVRTLLLL